MTIWSWRRIVTYVIALVAFPGLWTTTTVVVVHAFLDCPDGPTTFPHIVEHGEGTCYWWGPDESPYECCALCNELNSIIAEYLPPEQIDPFLGNVRNSASCCCYSSGFIVQGDSVNGSVYYIEPLL